MPNLVGTFVAGTYWAITYEVDIAFVLFWHIDTKLLGPFAHFS